MWTTIDLISGGHQHQIFMQLCELVEGNSVAEVFEGVEDTSIDDFYSWYCHDFIRTVHQVTHKKGALEYKVK